MNFYRIMEAWGLTQETKEVKRAVGHFCSRICECLRLPPYRVEEEPVNESPVPVKGRQGVMF